MTSPTRDSFPKIGTSLIPGTVIMYAGLIGDRQSSPERWGWMLCDGRTLEAALYPALFGAIGYQFGESGSPGTFRIPNLPGPVINGQTFNYLISFM